MLAPGSGSSRKFRALQEEARISQVPGPAAPKLVPPRQCGQSPDPGSLEHWRTGAGSGGSLRDDLVQIHHGAEKHICWRQEGIVLFSERLLSLLFMPYSNSGLVCLP